MKVHVGSKNITKISAVRDTVLLYPHLFLEPEVIGIDVNVELFGHPKNIDETVEGAIERARKAFTGCDYSVGLEGGLMAVPHTRSGYMEVGACAIYDGKSLSLGMAPGFEWPKKVTDMILRGEGDASAAFKRLGLTENEKLGASPGGIVGFLTDDKMSREDFSKYSIMMAIIQIDKTHLYS